MKYIGIDPGQRGAICVLNQDGAVTTLMDLPNTAQGIVKVLREATQEAQGLTMYAQDVAVCVERVGSRPTDGLRGLATFMNGAGIIEGACTALGFTVGLPWPQTWKRAFGLVGRRKEGSMKAAQGLAPDVTFRRHDEAEAYLLARFAYLQGGRWAQVCAELKGEKGAGLTGGKTKKPRRAPSGNALRKGRGKCHATQRVEAPGDTGILIVSEG
jgi:crossover junction endodeoxyribonuclease RuvC